MSVQTRNDEDKRSLVPYIATILNNISGLITADTYADDINPYIVYVPIKSGANITDVRRKAHERLKASKLTGRMYLKQMMLEIHVNKKDEYNEIPF